MMKKILVAVVLLSLLAGCSQRQVSASDLQRQVDNSVEKAVSIDVGTGTNISKKYYSLYLAAGLGRVSSTETTSTFNFYGVKALLNLDVAAIVTDSYYTDASTVNNYALRNLDQLTNPIVTKTGRFTNSKNETILYQIAIKQMDETFCYIMIQTNHFIFTALADSTAVSKTIYEMIKVLRSCQVNSDEVVTAYANTDDTAYVKTTITLFDETLPASGVIASYIDDWTSDPDFSIIDNSGQNDTDSPTADDYNSGSSDTTSDTGTTTQTDNTAAGQ